MVHTDLERRILGIARQPGERQRHAPMIVVGLVRRVHPAEAAEHQPQHLLAAGLADASGHRDDARFAAVAAGAAELVQRLERVGHADERAGGVAAEFGADHGESRTCGESLIDIVMAVGALAQNREEQLARLDGAGVDGDAGDGARHRADLLAIDGGQQFLSGPERLRHLSRPHGIGGRGRWPRPHDH
jgi:hypothetical protein